VRLLERDAKVGCDPDEHDMSPSTVAM